MNYQLLFWVFLWLSIIEFVLGILMYREISRITFVRDCVLDAWSTMIAEAEKIAKNTQVAANVRYHLLNTKMQEGITKLRRILSHR